MRLALHRRSLVLPGRRGPRAATTTPLSRSPSKSSPRRLGPVAVSAAPSPSSDLDAPPPPALLLPDEPEAHERNAAAISFYVRKFLDEEWRLELEDHASLGEAAALAYKQAVAAGSSPSSPAPPPRLDVGDVLLAVASDLSARPELFRETFTDAFEVANKVSELLVHGLSGGETAACGCVGEVSVALMVEAFEFADRGIGGGAVRED